MSANKKPIPRSILIFGAAAHIGKPLAMFLQREAPEIRLRLATSNSARVDLLRQQFPKAEVVEADYFDPPSLDAAVSGMEGVFVVTPGGTDEAPAMTNLITALRQANSAVHILRILGMQPEANPNRIPQFLRDFRIMLPVQHPIAKRLFDDSGLPVTYMNIGATFMDNYLQMRGALHRERKLIWPERLIPYIDTREIAEVAGRLFLSDNHRHIGQFHTLNNGQDIMRFAEAAELMSEVFQEKISYDGSQEAFFKEYAHLGDGLLRMLWSFFKYEEENEVVWARNDFVERMLGRKPLTVREWLQEHRGQLLG